MTIQFDQIKYEKFIEKDIAKLKNSAWFTSKSERLRNAVLSRPPFFLYRARVLNKEFIGMIEVYNEPMSTLVDAGVDCIYYCPKEFNPGWLKDRRFMQMKLHELQILTHRRVAQIHMEKRGITWPGIRWPLQIGPKRERPLIL
jgi:hypothetical protein